jgi:transcription initiation factor TFIIIB Brf1 subunit/transcription initiation factor TFIIB
MESEPSFTKSIKSILVRASLFAACRQLGIVKTFNEFEFDLPRSQKVLFHKNFKLIDSVLKKDALTNTVSPLEEKSTTVFPAAFTISDFIITEIKTLGLGKAIEERAIAISKVEDVKDAFSGKRANVVAAVIISFAAECEEHYLGSVPYAEAANVSEMTIKTAQKDLLKVVEEMATKGPLPPPFRAKWNFPNYKLNK